MVKQHKVYYRIPWKRDVTLLTSILRLHCQPTPSYKEISELLIKTWPSAMSKLAKDVVPKETQAAVLTSDKGIKEWLSQYLKERYELSEEWGSEPWITARHKDKSMVEEILRVTGSKEKGYEVMDKEEMRLQMKWKRENDWRYGSTPDRPERPEQGTQKKISEIPLNALSEPSGEQNAEPPVPVARKIARNIFQALHAKEQRTVDNTPHEPKVHPCWKTFAEQLKEFNDAGTPQGPDVPSGTAVKGWVGMQASNV
jgi:hypothetical protein